VASSGERMSLSQNTLYISLRNFLKSFDGNVGLLFVLELGPYHGNGVSPV